MFNQDPTSIHDLGKVVRLAELYCLIYIAILGYVTSRCRSFDTTGNYAKIVTCSCCPDPGGWLANREMKSEQVPIYVP
jgi:hypothetical protein